MRVSDFGEPPLALAVFVSRPQAELKSAREGQLYSGSSGKIKAVDSAVIISESKGRKNIMRSLVLALVLLASGLSWPAAAAAPLKCKLIQIAEFPVRLERNRLIVEGAINGRKIGILLDTGASFSLIQRSATARLGLARHEARGYRMFGVGGETTTEAVHIDEFKIGQSVRKNWRVLVAGEHDLGEDVALILGDDFFHGVDVEFDLAHDAVRLFQPVDCAGAPLAYWTTERVGEVPIETGPKIGLSVEVNGQPVRALLDSGSSVSMLAMSLAVRLGITPETPGVVAGNCAIGIGKKPVQSWIGQFESFAIGNEIIRNPTIYFADLWKHTTYTETGSRLPKDLGDLPAMLLGADFLRAHRVFVAHSQSKIYFSYVGGAVFPTGPVKSCPQGDAKSGGGEN